MVSDNDYYFDNIDYYCSDDTGYHPSLCLCNHCSEYADYHHTSDNSDNQVSDDSYLFDRDDYHQFDRDDHHYFDNDDNCDQNAYYHNA